MSSMNVYLSVSTVLFTLLFMVWTTRGWTNTMIKFVFLGMAVAGGCELASSLGYIVKV